MIKLIHLLERITDLLDRPLEIAAIILAFFSVSMAFSQVVSRYFFGVTNEFIAEFSVYALLYGILLFSGTALKSGKHVSMDFIYTKIRGGAKSVLQIILTTVSFLICIAITSWSIQWVYQQWVTGELTVSSVAPKWAATLAMPIGISFLCFYSLVELLKSVVNLFEGRQSC